MACSLELFRCLIKVSGAFGALSVCASSFVRCYEFEWEVRLTIAGAFLLDSIRAMVGTFWKVSSLEELFFLRRLNEFCIGEFCETVKSCIAEST